jgi:hypothetical protein
MPIMSVDVSHDPITMAFDFANLGLLLTQLGSF